MNPNTHRRLKELREATDKEYGKLVQKLLAIAFLESGVDSLTERSIQGIDLEVGIAGTRYAFEVKTSEKDSISLGKKDFEGLRSQIEEDVEVYIAVLFGSSLLDEWLMVRYHEGELLPAKKYSQFMLRPYRNRELEDRIRACFDTAVADHANTARLERQGGLDHVLEGYGNRRLA